MKQTYNDPAKEKSRERLKLYLETYLRPHKKPQDIKVVCFPGAEVKGEEALEVLQVYDQLGIPRKNIVGLEYNPSAAERLRTANLGLEVICQDSLDFFKTTDKKFDVISLDYTGQRTWKEEDTTRYIVGRRLLNNRGIFCTNHAIKRESKKMQEQLLKNTTLGNVVWQVYNSIDPSLFGTPEFEKEVDRRFSEVEGDLVRLRQKLEEKTLSLDSIRTGITLDNLSIFGGGISELNPEKHLFANNVLVKEIIKHLTDEKANSGSMGLSCENPSLYYSITAFQHVISSAKMQLINGGFSEEVAQTALLTVLMTHNNASAPKNLERYTYTSNKNYKMLMDIFQVNEVPHKWERDANYLLRPDTKNGLLRPISPYFLSRKDRKVFERFREESDSSFFRVEVNTPIDLGSSYRPPEKISKDEAITLLQDGLSPAEIADCYEGFKGQRKNEKNFKTQLAALKAHLTMGTYESKTFKGEY